MTQADSSVTGNSGSAGELRNPMPEVDTFSADEILLARFAVGVVRNGGNMFLGRLFECHVARLLNGELSPLGVWPWDVRLPDGTCLEVKSGTTSFKLDGGVGADAWVFTRKSATGVSDVVGFYVASKQKVEALRLVAGRLTLARADKELGLVGPEQLLSEIRRVVGEP